MGHDNSQGISKVTNMNYVRKLLMISVSVVGTP